MKWPARLRILNLRAGFFIERVRMDKEKPNYYAIIPARVRYADIMPNAKLLYGEITALASQEGYCWASNGYFADLYKVSEKQVSLWFKQLIDSKFIEIELIKNEKGTLRKSYLLEEKVIRALRKGNVGQDDSTLPKGNTNNTSLILKNNKGEAGLLDSPPAQNKDFRGQHSPTKELIKEKIKAGNLKDLKNA